MNPLAALVFHPGPRRRALRVLGILSLLFILLVGVFSAQGQHLPLDVELSEAWSGVESPLLAGFFDLIGIAGYSPWNALIGLAVMIAVGWWRGWRVGVFLLVLTVLQGVAGILLKFPIRVDRPMETVLNAPLDIIRVSSFPSGHTMMYIVLFGFPTYLLFRHGAPHWLRMTALALSTLLVLFVGPARVHDGAHWWTDVIGALLLGFFILLLGIHFYDQRLLPRVEHDAQRTGEQSGA